MWDRLHNSLIWLKLNDKKKFDVFKKTFITFIIVKIIVVLALAFAKTYGELLLIILLYLPFLFKFVLEITKISRVSAQ